MYISISLSLNLLSPYPSFSLLSPLLSPTSLSLLSLSLSFLSPCVNYCEQIELGNINVHYIPGKVNSADVFTKPLGLTSHNALLPLLGLHLLEGECWRITILCCVLRLVSYFCYIQFGPIWFHLCMFIQICTIRATWFQIDLLSYWTDLAKNSNSDISWSNYPWLTSK